MDVNAKDEGGGGFGPKVRLDKEETEKFNGKSPEDLAFRGLVHNIADMVAAHARRDVHIYEHGGESVAVSRYNRRG